MRFIKLISITTFIAIAFFSCERDAEDIITAGTVSLNDVVVEINGETGRSEVSLEELSFLIKDSDNVELFQWDNSEEIPDTLTMESGDYTIVAYSDTVSLPTLSNNFYNGEQSFTISAGEHTNVDLTVAPAGAKLTIAYADNLSEDFINYYAEVADPQGTTVTMDSITLGPLYLNPGTTEITIYLVYLGAGNDTVTQTVSDTYELVAGDFLQLSVEAALDLGRGAFNINIEGYNELAETLEFSMVNLDRDLIAYYPFNGNANDESTNANNGTVSGANLIEDRNGNPNSAYDFDGVDDYIDLGGSTILSLGNYDAFTVSMWINPDTELTGAGKGLFGKYSTSNDERIYSFSYHETKDFAMRFFENGIFDNRFVLEAEVQTGEWQILTCTYNQGEAKIYLGETLTASGTVSFQIEEGLESTNVVIGAVDRISADYDGNFDGSIDDIRVYNRELSTNEIQALTNL